MAKNIKLLDLLLVSCTLSCMHPSTKHTESKIPKDHRLKMVILEQTETIGLINNIIFRCYSSLTKSSKR